MTLNQLIQRAKEQGVDFDQEIDIWVEGCRRTPSDISTDCDGTTMQYDHPNN